jgi:chemotaxis protein MotD
MTASVTQASTIAANAAPAGTRHSRQEHGSGFSQMLDVGGPHRAGAPAEAPAKAGPAKAHEGQNRHPQAGAETPAKAEREQAAGGTVKPVARGDDAIEEAADPELEAPDAAKDEPDSGPKQELPSQIKAEQTISALMALAPVERRAPAAAAQAGSPKPGVAPAKFDTAAAEPDNRRAEPDSGRRGQIGVRASGGGDARVTHAGRKDEAATLADRQPSAAGPKVEASAPAKDDDTSAGIDSGHAARPAARTAALGAASVSTKPVDNRPSAAPATTAIPAAKPVRVSEAPATTAARNVAAEPIDRAGSVAPPAPARSGKARSEADGGRKPNLPPAVDAPRPATANAAPASKPVGARKDGDETRDGLARGGGKAAPEARRGEPQPAAAKVAVIGQQAAPAPAAPVLSANAAAVVTAIAREQGWRFAGKASAEPALALRNAQPMRSLKIELHPAELGAVTATLKASGDRLSVELKVENHEAYARLSTDSEAIVQSLRSLGYDIDRVSIQQPQAAATVAAGSDASAGAGQFSRDTSSFQPGNPGSGGERFGGQTNRQGSRDDGQHHGEPREIVQDRAGGSLYI